MKLKVCGMKYSDNIKEVSSLRPDYLGFIFWGPSKRFFEGNIPEIAPDIKKVGVFVDASLTDILKIVERHDLAAVQLHGTETPSFCQQVINALGQSSKKVEVIKVFSIKDNFDFNVLLPYEDFCDYFLFDTKGELPGGNGYKFDWKLLKDYPSSKPYFLSGGIGLDEKESVRSFLKGKESRYCYAIDVNSKFEIEPGLKNIDNLKEFIKIIE